jgi:hypothetical protein
MSRASLRAVPPVDALTGELSVRRRLPGGPVEEVLALPIAEIGALHDAVLDLLPTTYGAATGYAEQLAEAAQTAYVGLLTLHALLAQTSPTGGEAPEPS